MLDFLLEYSGVAKALEPPVTLEEILGNYCETPEKFSYTVGLLERLPRFSKENLKLSNCFFRGQLPYDSLIGLTNEDLNELLVVMDYLDFPKNLMEKLKPVIENMISFEKYKISFEFFDFKNTSHWSSIGDLEGLKYAYEQGYSWDGWTCTVAAEKGHLECLKYAHAPPVGEGCPWDEPTCSWAAVNGHLECLKYAHEHGCSWGEWTCSGAASNGHLECLKYAHTQGCPWDEWTCTYAAHNGHLECLKYAHEQGCPWDIWTCIMAAENGHLECLKYAHTQGCPWDKSTCEWAANNGHLECLNYARTHGCPG